jgi:hypothetical protein
MPVWPLLMSMSWWNKLKIEFFSFVTDKVTRITELGEGIVTLAVSPDQRWLFYSQRETEVDIMLVENFR